MGDIGTPLTEGSIPAVGTAGTTYASELNLFLTEVQARLEAEVPKSSLEDGDLDMNGYSVQNTSYVGISDGGGPVTPSNTLQASGGNLYWVTSTGAAQITDGNLIAAASIGGITGDYGGANPAQFRFVDADQEYYAYDDYGTGAWARLWARTFDVAAGATSTDRVRLAFGGASSYVMTLPPSVPAANRYLSMDSSGNVTAGDDSVNVLNLPGASCVLGVYNVGTRGNSGAVTTGTSTSNYYYPVPVSPGDIVTGWTLYVTKGTTDTLQGRFYVVSADGTLAQQGSTQTLNTAVGATTMGETLGSPPTIAAGESVVLEVRNASGGGNDGLENLLVSRKRY